MASKGVDTMLELRSQLQEKKATLVRQVEEERRRVARLEQESIQVNLHRHNTNSPTPRIVLGNIRDAVQKSG